MHIQVRIANLREEARDADERARKANANPHLQCVAHLWVAKAMEYRQMATNLERSERA